VLFHYWFCKLYYNLQIICTHAHGLDTWGSHMQNWSMLVHTYYFFSSLEFWYMLMFLNILLPEHSESNEFDAVFHEILLRFLASTSEKIEILRPHACVTFLMANVWTGGQGWNCGKYLVILYLYFCKVWRFYTWHNLDVRRYCKIYVLVYYIDKTGS